MDLKTRHTLFAFTCIPLRLLLAYAAYTMPLNFLPLLGVVVLAMGASMLYLYFTNGRLNAPEGGGDTWWKNLRLLHGSLFLCAAVYALNRDRRAYIPLLIDPIVGLIAFIHKHKLLF